MTVYRVPSSVATAELRERGSRFRAWVSEASHDGAALELIEVRRRQEPDATHHCWAWRLGASGMERSSDDGEPAGTAGRPILNVLRGAELSDVVAIVTRWYGGTKLGKGGLARAYAGVVKEALSGLRVAERWPTTTLLVEVPYTGFGALQRLVHPPEVAIRSQAFGPTIRAELVVRSDRVRELDLALARIGATRVSSDG